ncbi:Glutathione S-transferase theta-2B-like [Oopsacas minuta]|uniref:Glutathione S-transferase theta-2B-like n=1 Tax=Oopsacas minuta TaxID=111878 RepID=A0AAV7JUX2_9METZ|nr:Glutathione S-transferase theta-2B-like [Oopsacas minuta]
MSGLKIFVDLVSQPSRAVALLLEVNNIPYNKVVVNLGKGEHLSHSELKAVNPNTKVPALQEGKFCLYESGAILRYICSSRQLPDHWYPKDLERRALVDQYLDWHHSTIRIGCAHWFFAQHIARQPPTHHVIVDSKATLLKAFSILNDYTLQDNKFLTGEMISIADIQAICELTQHWMVGRNVYSGYPNIEKWVAACIKELQPQFDQVHGIIYKIKSRGLFGTDTNPEPLKSKL